MKFLKKNRHVVYIVVALYIITLITSFVSSGATHAQSVWERDQMNKNMRSHKHGQ
jgi:DNA-binding transcriptional regulator WhiA